MLARHQEYTTFLASVAALWYLTCVEESRSIEANAHRRRIVERMFWLLLGGVNVLAGALIFSAWLLRSKMDDYVQGVVLTALAGAISSLLTFMGLIVKGLVDNLGLGDSQPSERNTESR